MAGSARMAGNPMSICRPSASTDSMSLNGSASKAGETIIAPLDINIEPTESLEMERRQGAIRTALFVLASSLLLSLVLYLSQG